MTPETITNLYMDAGIVGCMVVAFLGLLVWVLKENKRREEAAAAREEKLYTVIDSLSSQLPVIKESLDRIESRMDNK